MASIITKNSKETKDVAAFLAKQLKKGGILTLSGDLGGGKTTFTQGLARAFGIKSKIISPTFAYLREYKVPKSKLCFAHFDLYRIKDEKSLAEIGFLEYLERQNCILVIEWAERAKNVLNKKDCLQIKFDFIDENKRKLIFSAKGKYYQSIIKKLAK